ncbi:MAG TPA: hypothetical protein VEL05_01030 [Candidatus Acidoferrum sp.]|nr:hypothetical protein [Candidatus Acidoferrum sp.]
MSRDDRDLPGELDQDQPVTPAEQTRAEAFGKWIDALSAGEPLPPAMDSDDRALLETASMVLASSRAVDLEPERARRLVDEALENAMVGQWPPADSRSGEHHLGTAPRGLTGRALGRLSGSRAVPPEGDGDDREAASRSSTDLVLSGRRRADRVLRHLPWAVASLAAAAAVVLFVTTHKHDRKGQAPVPPVAERPLRLQVANTSRPADPLIGPIDRRDAGGASERLDILFADRMDGYRDLVLRRALRVEEP